MARQNQHVGPYCNQWAVRGEGNSRGTSVQDTQSEAVAVAIPIAERRQAEVVIHRPNGQIRDKDSYGPDPASIRDTRF